MTFAKTIRPVGAFDHGQEAIKPEFLRLPKSGHLCPHSGLSRSKLNELILGPAPAVKSISLRKRGQIRGVRLIVFDSLMSYLYGLSRQDQTRGSREEEARS